jgi:hypothetical protein
VTGGALSGSWSPPAERAKRREFAALGFDPAGCTASRCAALRLVASGWGRAAACWPRIWSAWPRPHEGLQADRPLVEEISDTVWWSAAGAGLEAARIAAAMGHPWSDRKTDTLGGLAARSAAPEEPPYDHLKT